MYSVTGSVRKKKESTETRARARARFDVRPNEESRGSFKPCDREREEWELLVDRERSGEAVERTRTNWFSTSESSTSLSFPARREGEKEISYHSN